MFNLSDNTENCQASFESSRGAERKLCEESTSFSKLTNDIFVFRTP